MSKPEDFEIENGVLIGYTGDDEICIPENVIKIGRYLFMNRSFSKITVEKGNKVFDSRDNCNAIIDTQTNTLVLGCMNTVIPYGIKSIGEDAFYGCKGLHTIKIPDSVTNIGINAFKDCENLTDIVIPNSVKNLQGLAFSSCANLKNVILSENITSIDVNAFRCCKSIKSIVIPDSVTEIQDYAFGECENLQNIIIPDNVTSIGGCAFVGCCRLAEVTIPDSVTSIGGYAFGDCKSLKTVRIGKGLTDISPSAFRDCDGLVSITIDEENKKFDSRNNCNAVIETETDTLVSASCNTVIPDNIKHIGNDAFLGRKVPSTLILPDAIKTVGDNSFQECVNLNSVIIPDSITDIGKNAFRNCTELVSVSLPQNLKKIESGTFFNCCNLTAINIPDCILSIGSGAFSGCENLSDLRIPDSVVYIGDYAFKSCKKLKTITVPNLSTAVGCGAFWNCLNTIIIYNSRIIDYKSFVSRFKDVYSGKCLFTNISPSDLPSQLKQAGVLGFIELFDQVPMPESVILDYISFIKRQKKKYFSKAKSNTALMKFVIEHRMIPLEETDEFIDSVDDAEIKLLLIEYKKSFGEKGIQKLEKKKSDELDKIIGLKELTLADYKKLYGFEFVRKGDGYTLKRYKGKDTVVSVPGMIRNMRVTGIECNAFSYCKDIEEVIIPDSITYIGRNAFDYCYGLKRCRYIGSVSHWCSILFESVILNSKCELYINNEVVTELTAEDLKDVTEINEFAFKNYAKLKSITIPVSVKKIGNMAFDNCSNLKKCDYLGTPAQWCEMVFESNPCQNKKCNLYFNGKKLTELNHGNLSGITKINDRAFECCKSLISVTLPSSVTEIGNMAFEYCEGLKSVKISDECLIIGNKAFYECSAVTDVLIGNKIKSIGDLAFFGCKEIEEILIPYSVSFVGKDTFNKCNKLTIKCKRSSYIYRYVKVNKLKFLRIDKDNEQKEQEKFEIFGKIFVHTGLEDDDKVKVENAIVKNGGIIKSSVVLNTDYLVYNPNYDHETTKLKRAKELIFSKGKPIKIITTDEFYFLLSEK